MISAEDLIAEGYVKEKEDGYYSKKLPVVQPLCYFSPVILFNVQDGTLTIKHLISTYDWDKFIAFRKIMNLDQLRVLEITAEMVCYTSQNITREYEEYVSNYDCSHKCGG